MDISTFLGGKYLNAAAVKSRVPLRLTIANVAQEQVHSENKLIVYFHSEQSGLCLNKSNTQLLASMFGTDSDRWINQPIELVIEPTMFQGNMVDSIRVRSAMQQAPASQVQQPQPAPAPPQPQQPPQQTLQPQVEQEPVVPDMSDAQSDW